MIVPSIDIMNGRSVQLVGGKGEPRDCGNPLELAKKFARVGEVAIVDLDAALGTGSNKEIIKSMLPLGRFRVGGGIRTVEQAREWLDAGAYKIVIGTAATPEFLQELPRERVIVALDSVDGMIQVDGWQRATTMTVREQLSVLEPYCSGFLLTLIENEGRLGGLDQELMQRLLPENLESSLTIAGGIRSAEEIAQLDAIGADSQVGMAIYTGVLDFAEAFLAPVKRDANGLIATVVCDEAERALGLVWSSIESVRASIESGRGTYWSRSRQELWQKGATSGATQEVMRIEMDCDRDALRFIVNQSEPGFCHEETANCWGEAIGLRALEKTVGSRLKEAPEGSYTSRLIRNERLLAAKLEEEANELAQAQTKADVIHEAADLLYFATVAMQKAGVQFSDVASELDRRALRVTRRPGNANRPLRPFGGIHS